MKICAACAVFVTLLRCGLALQSPFDSKTTAMQMLSMAGYRAEEHVARTDDGYLLQVHRISGAQKSQDGSATLPPVLLMHGMIGSSSDFLIMGPKRSLGFLLADAGYDVYLGNMRFNMYASHENKTKDDPSYWDFSIDEHGLYDAPAIVELVLRVSGAPATHYIGYSMGATAYMMMCDRRSDLAAKIASFVGLAPAVHMSNLRPMAQVIFGLQLPKLLRSRGVNHLSLGQFQSDLAQSLCNPKAPSEDLCFTFAFLFIGDDYDQVEWDMVSTVFAKMQPATVKEVEHYLQLSTTDTLQQFDHGEEENMIKYGSKTPPAYDLKANKAPVALFYGNNDRLTSANEIAAIARTYRKTRTLMHLRKVPWQKFNHYDFIFAKDIHTLMNNEVIKKIIQLGRSLKASTPYVQVHQVKWNKFNHFDFVYAKDVHALLNRKIIKTINSMTKLYESKKKELD